MCNESTIYKFFKKNYITENNEHFHNILINREGAVYMCTVTNDHAHVWILMNCGRSIVQYVNYFASGH